MFLTASISFIGNTVYDLSNGLQGATTSAPRFTFHVLQRIHKGMLSFHTSIVKSTAGRERYSVEKPALVISAKLSAGRTELLTVVSSGQ